MLILIFVLVIVAFILGAQTGFVLTKRTVMRRIKEELDKTDTRNAYGMIWWRGYRGALQNLYDTLFEDDIDEVDDDGG